MSDSICASKRLPLCLSLGVTTVLAEQKNNENDLLNQFSLQEKTSYLNETDNFVLVCGNKQKTNIPQPNYSQISLAVRRALALKNHTRFPVLLVVNNKYEGTMIVDQFNKIVSCFKLYNTIYSLKDKINSDIHTKYSNEADFILTTYTKLWEQVTNRKNPLCEQVVFVNPLTRRNILSDVSKLDIITGCLHRHKCHKPNFSFIFDEAQFPILTKADYNYLFNTNNVLFYRCKEVKWTLFENPFQGAIPKLQTEQFQLFILRELFRGRKTIKELLTRFKMTFTYKLHLYSNSIFHQEKLLEQKLRLDQIVLAGLVKQLYLFTKGNSKTILGTISTNDIFDNDEKNHQITVTWEEPKETRGYLPLVTKKNDSKYYLSALGEAILAVSTNFSGVAVNFGAVLDHLTKILFTDENSERFSLKEIIYFYLKLIGTDEEDTSNFMAKIPENLNTIQNDALVKLLKEKFSIKKNSYTLISAEKILEAFEKLMDTDTYLFFQQFKMYQKDEQRSWEEKRREAILREANYQPLTVKYTGNKYHMLWQQAKKELESLQSDGMLVRIITYDCSGRSKFKYCTQGLLDANPHLQKSCGNCQWYNKRFRTCTYLRLLQANDPSKIHSDYREYANGTISYEASACGNFEDKAKYEAVEDGVQFTSTVSELSQRMKNIPSSYIIQNTSEIKYLCLTCQEQIDEFGTDSVIFFPRKRVICLNCATIYLQKKNQKVTVRTEYRHLQRSLYYKATGSVPQILKEKDPSYVFVIYDTENVRLELDETNEYKSFDLIISNQKISLDKVQYLYFSGQRYQDLEETLKILSELEPERYSYSIKRAEQKSTKKSTKNKNGFRKPFSSEEYNLLKNLIKKISEKETFNQSFLRARHLSNIGGMLTLKMNTEAESLADWSFNHQLFNMIDLLIQVDGGVKSSVYGCQLEAQSNKYFFELLKNEANRVDLWSKGRVNSRLVKDMLLAYSRKTSSAFSPCDTILNQLLRTIRSVIDDVFREVGLEPAKMGSGLFHKRKTKSDIDNLGFYFDLIEPVRVLVLVTMSKAIKNGLLSFNDCSYVLGENGQEIYQVKGSSQEKIKELILEALEVPICYRGETMPFLQAFKQYLVILKMALENCFTEIRKHKRISVVKLQQCFDDAEFSPFVFCPAGIEDELVDLNHFAQKEGVLFRGREEEVLHLKNARESFRKIAMRKWLVKDKIFGLKKLRITKHQKKEQDRNLVVLLLMFYYAHERNYFFEKYSTTHIRELLGITQNQVQRLLARMVSRDFLIIEKIAGKNYYQLNIDNKSINELRFALGVTLSRDEEMQRELIKNSPYHLERISKVVSTIRVISIDKPKIINNNLWNKWNPTAIISKLIFWSEKQIASSLDYFKILGEIYDNK